MPRLTGVLETSLYVTDLEESLRFYQEVLGLEVLESGGRLCALRLADGQVLLLCERGACADLPTGAHDGSGRLHLALAIPAADLSSWETQLSEHGVAIEERRVWERGGSSMYFRDPDGHLIELATPGTWSIY
jgi:catechol 2,3-dioxygenase-like lactoylglutathione lyase family enzyme